MKSLGRFDQYGGCYVSELLIPVLTEVEEAFLRCKDDRKFNEEFLSLLKEFAGRPTPITEMKKLGAEWGCTLVLKREDLLHGGAHKTNNV
ncbi:MAG: tryptophan synthase subunit beta, partial [Candidatus Peregrinibacteria bacterium]